MAVGSCPGSHRADWKLGDIFEHACPSCGYKMEFFRDDTRRRCENCNELLVNPRRPKVGTIEVNVTETCDEAKI